MNCKPGDLAITVGAPMDNGLIVEVMIGGPWMHPWLGPCWRIHSLGSKFHYAVDETRAIVKWPDSMLRPIRGGDLAEEDETQDLPIPAPAKEHA